MRTIFILAVNSYRHIYEEILESAKYGRSLTIRVLIDIIAKRSFKHCEDNVAVTKELVHWLKGRGIDAVVGARDDYKLVRQLLRGVDIAYFCTNVRHYSDLDSEVEHARTFLCCAKEEGKATHRPIWGLQSYQMFFHSLIHRCLAHSLPLNACGRPCLYRSARPQ